MNEETIITEEYFKEKTGYDPIQDDLERANCTLAGTLGHYSCGWCEEHDLPHFQCGCGIRNNGAT